jgi:hypothetical protein
MEVNKINRAAQTLGSAVPSLLELHDFTKAKRFIDIYETKSDLFDESGNIEKGREIYYSIKGRYYLAINNLDSAEYMFRKELRYGKDLNNMVRNYYEENFNIVLERAAFLTPEKETDFDYFVTFKNESTSYISSLSKEQLETIIRFELEKELEGISDIIFSNQNLEFKLTVIYIRRKNDNKI